jgi:hypothetical protein
MLAKPTRWVKPSHRTLRVRAPRSRSRTRLSWAWKAGSSPPRRTTPSSLQSRRPSSTPATSRASRRGRGACWRSQHVWCPQPLARSACVRHDGARGLAYRGRGSVQLSSMTHLPVGQCTYPHAHDKPRFVALSWRMLAEPTRLVGLTRPAPCTVQGCSYNVLS